MLRFQFENCASRPGGWAQLDSVRLILSSIVVLSHVNYMFITPLGYVDLFPFIQLCAFLAVLAFFILSGLVIGRSLSLRRDGFFAFMVRRIGRLYPALIASFVLVIVLHAWLRLEGISLQAPSNAEPMIHSFSYDLNDAALSLVTFGLGGQLQSDSNAALWSLAIEMRCYVIAGLFAQLMLARSMLIQILSGTALVCVLAVILFDLPDRKTALCYLAFGFGIALSLFVKRIPSVIPVIRPDISYSLFIFHFPIMLAIFFMFYNPEVPSIWQALSLSMLSIVVSFILSLASALSIERVRIQSNIRSVRTSGAALQRSAETQAADL